MLTDKQVKKRFKEEASQNPDAFYPTTYLKREGFMRKSCIHCSTNFWTVNDSQTICGDPSCSGGFRVVGDNPAKSKLSYIQVWEKIVEMLEPKGYIPVKRYPVVARWNPTADFVMASIAAFQPYVITGEVRPPAEKLIIPQFSLRFGDIDNVGITGSHLTGFVMIGQHVFVDESKWNQEQFFKDIYEFLTSGVGLSKKEITIHEDAWAGGGSFGPCMEFFSRGVELFNQVYTMFEQTPKGDRPLKLKVLDMGLGMERIAWFSQGTPNIYEATFPQVLEQLRKKAHITMDFELYNTFSSHSAYLNVDEAENIEEAWKDVAKKMSLSVEKLREAILPMTAIYSIAEHARTLLVAINDGGLPSNVGGGYNLRVIFRRAQAFIDQFGWDIDMGEVAAWHANELHAIFPELQQNIENVQKILAVEKEKYLANKQKAADIVSKIIQKEITTETLLDLYDSNGISPDMVQAEAMKHGKKIHIPDNFYVLVAERHEKQEQIHATRRELDIDIPEDEETEVLYYDDADFVMFTAKVTHICGPKKQYLILDKTAFYPTSGGQIHDTGSIKINNHAYKVVDVIKQGKTIIHCIEHIDEKPITIVSGDIAEGFVDAERRRQLTVHHTATHVINAAARHVLGTHINQIGAKKTVEKATLDITHYESLSENQLRAIEDEANTIIAKKLPVKKFFLTRDMAEQRYGLGIYQGGAIPGNDLRMVLIGEQGEVDVECCAGTHTKNTTELGHIKIIKSSKISDGVVRLTYVAGERAQKEHQGVQALVEEVATLLECTPQQIPSRAEELFNKWKKVKKAAKKGKELDASWFILESTKEAENEVDVLLQTATLLSTQQENLVKTLTRFKSEIAAAKK